MASIFRKVQTRPAFWTSVQGAEVPTGQILVSGTLTLTGRDTALGKTAFFQLTKTNFYQRATEHSPVLREGDIQWVTVLPFTEYIRKEMLYGFSIKYRDETIDFYVSREEEMEKWLDAFGKTSVLQDIEDDYQITRSIGCGGQSTVFEAQDLVTGERVAVKSFEKQLLVESEKKFRALVGEIAVLRELSHPRIVALYKVYENITQVQLVMEFIPGEELFQSLSLTGAFSEAEAKGFMHNLLDVLKYMEENRVIHRDMKPENIILTNPADKTEFKVIDFGFATKYLGTELVDTCGSPGYVAPEIILMHHHGPSVDIYSSGIIFYVLLCGYSPFYSTKKAEVIKKNAKNEIIFSGVWADIDQRLIRMIKVMTNFTAGRRTNATDLSEFLAGRAAVTVEAALRRTSMLEPANSCQHLPLLKKAPVTSGSNSPVWGVNTFSKACLQIPKLPQGKLANMRY